MRRQWIETGTYRVVMSSYCGMTYYVAEGLDREDAIEVIRGLAARRHASGHEVTEDTDNGLPCFEFGEPEGSVMVPDTAGTAHIAAETRPAAECWECGSLVAIGEVCDCWNNDDQELE